MNPKFNFKRLGETFEADWPVVVSVPQDGGTVTKEEFMARFRLITDADLAEITKDDKDGKALYRAFWVGFGKGTDEEFTPELMEHVLSANYARGALFTAYQLFAQGIAAKN